MERLCPEDLLFKYEQFEAEGFAWHARALAAERRGAGITAQWNRRSFVRPHRTHKVVTNLAVSEVILITCPYT